MFGSSGRDALQSRQSRNALCPFNPEILPGQTVCLDRVAGMLCNPGKVATHFAHSIRRYSPAKQCVWIEWPGCFAIPAKSQRTLPIQSGDTPRPNSVFGSSGRDASRSRQSRNALCPFNPGILPGQTVCLDRVAGIAKHSGRFSPDLQSGVRKGFLLYPLRRKRLFQCCQQLCRCQYQDRYSSIP